MPTLSKSNTLRHAELIEAIRAIRIDDLTDSPADNANDMQGRHHALISAVVNYIEADIAAFNYAAGTTLHARNISSTLDATFSDFIAPEYREARTWLREAEEWKPYQRDEHRIGTFEAGVRAA